MKTYTFNINISYKDFILVYQGGVKSIVVREYGGKTIALPAGKFKEFVNHSGVNGQFELRLADGGKFLSLQRIDA